MTSAEIVQLTVRASLVIKTLSGLISCRSKTVAMLTYREAVNHLRDLADWLDKLTD